MLWATATHRTYRTIIIIGIIAISFLALSWPDARQAHAQGGTTHTVQIGENLFRIALRYNMTVDTLAAANGISDPTRIYVGQVLTIPDPSAPVNIPVVVSPASNPAPAPAPAASGTTHIVQPGETLASIGRYYGVSWTDIVAANGLANPNHIYSGQRLVIPVGGAPVPAPAPAPVNPAPANPAPAAGQQRIHIVQPGQHLASIARIYGLSWSTIAAANNIANPNHIYSGQQLVIPASDSGVPAYQPAPAAPTVATGKQVVVDLSDQMVYAYENNQLLKSVRVSTGLPGTPTVQGDYRIYVKYESQTMSGPGYYLPGVPYVMYFYQGYGLHGTYWHNNFGQPMSHGCVNMPTTEAAWFYSWAPVGTAVHVQY